MLVSVTNMKGRGITLVRFSALSIEETYYKLAEILEPLQIQIGFKPYSDRITK